MSERRCILDAGQLDGQPAASSPLAGTPPAAVPGGVRPRPGEANDQMGPVPGRRRFFKIPDEWGEWLGGYVFCRLQFHVAIFGLIEFTDVEDC